MTADFAVPGAISLPGQGFLGTTFLAGEELKKGAGAFANLDPAVSTVFFD